MLKQLTLKNFRKHTDLTLDFTQGLNALRGANESGKSTVAESILYALYGSRTLRDTLEETVTWGQPATSLKVTLVIDVQGKEITFERSKAGATVYVGDKVHVTGQNEVTAYAAEALGADAKTAAMLMMASQSDLRGSLDEGPTAVSALIGKLADFETIDLIITRAQERLLLGSEGPFLEKLKRAKEDVEQAAGQLVNPTSILELMADRGAALGKAEMTRLAIDTMLAPAAADTSKALADVIAHNKLVDTNIVAVARAAADLATLESDRDAAAALATKRPVAADIDAARADVQQEAAFSARLKVYLQVAGLPEYPSAYWEGTAESFRTETSALVLKAAQLADRVVAERHRVRDLEARKIKDGGKCPTCGHAALGDDHVAQHNADLDAQVAEITAGADDLVREKAWAMDDLAEMNKIEKAAKPFLAVSASADVEVNLDFYPPRITWVGGSMEAAPTGAAARLEALVKAEREATLAEGRAAALDVAVKAKAAEREALVAAALVYVDVTALVQADRDAQALLQEALSLESADVVAAAALEARINELQARADRADRDLAAAKGRVEELEQDIKALGFNNGLMGKLKKMKPIVTDRLWQIVLTSVSTFFTQIRGESSVVTKEAAGFRVNGHSVASLSGSTLDSLAIAIRVALTKTFIPHASFLCLDEPAHGADSTRTSSILGFLAGAGFTQTILATHDSLSESVADNVILLGD
jgi:hypothetical protein